MLTVAATANVLVGVRVDPMGGEVVASLPWHPAPINATAMNKASQQNI